MVAPKRPKRERKFNGLTGEALVKACSELVDETIMISTERVVRGVARLHVGMLTPVLSDVGAGLVVNALHMDGQLPDELRAANPDPNGPTPLEACLTHALKIIAREAARHGVALSFRVKQERP